MLPYYYIANSKGYYGYVSNTLNGLNFPKFPFTTKGVKYCPSKKFSIPFNFTLLHSRFYRESDNIGFHLFVREKEYYIETYNTLLRNLGVFCSASYLMKYKDASQPCIVSIVPSTYFGRNNFISDNLDMIKTLLTKDWVTGIEFDVSGIDDTICYEDDLYYLSSSYIKREKPFYLKLNYTQDPNDFWMDGIDELHISSINYLNMQISGKLAQQYNWPALKNWIRKGFKVSGSDVTSIQDIIYLESIGCSSIGIDPSIINSISFKEYVNNEYSKVYSM